MASNFLARALFGKNAASMRVEGGKFIATMDDGTVREKQGKRSGGLGGMVSAAVSSVKTSVIKPVAQAAHFVTENPVRLATTVAGGVVLGPVGMVVGATKKGSDAMVKGATYAAEHPVESAQIAVGGALIATGVGTAAGAGLLGNGLKSAIAEEQARKAKQAAEREQAAADAAYQAELAAYNAAQGGSVTAAVTAQAGANVGAPAAPLGLFGWLKRVLFGK